MLGLRIKNNAAELRFFTLLATQQSLRSYVLFVDDRPAAFLYGTLGRNSSFGMCMSRIIPSCFLTRK